MERTVIERVHVESELNDRGLATSDGEANFTWVDLGDHDEAAVMKGLGERGVIVRAGQDLGGPGHLRVTFGTRPRTTASWPLSTPRSPRSDPAPYWMSNSSSFH